MTTEKMTVHKALCELKLLKKRIDDAIDECSVVRTNQHSVDKISGIPVKEYENLMESSYNKVTDLIARRKAIKKAVVMSNAVTKITVAGVEMTMAEAINLKDDGILLDQLFLNEMKRQYAQAVSDVVSRNSTLNEMAEKYVLGLFGNKENTKSDEAEAAKKTYVTNHTIQLVDPLNIKEKIEVLENKISAFQTEVDGAISTSNALTEITIEY